MYVFLSAPFSSMVTADGSVDMRYRSQVEQIIDVLERNGCEVYCDMREYHWRLYNEGASQAFWNNISAIQNCNLHLAITRKNPISAGVELELGVAYALKKRIIIFDNTDGLSMPFINKGLIEREKVQVHAYKTMDDVPKLIEKFVIPDIT